MKQEELSEMVIRKDLAESKLGNVHKDYALNTEKLQVRVKQNSCCFRWVLNFWSTAQIRRLPDDSQAKGEGVWGNHGPLAGRHRLAGVWKGRTEGEGQEHLQEGHHGGNGKKLGSWRSVFISKQFKIVLDQKLLIQRKFIFTSSLISKQRNNS